MEPITEAAKQLLESGWQPIMKCRDGFLYVWEKRSPDGCSIMAQTTDQATALQKYMPTNNPAPRFGGAQ